MNKDTVIFCDSIEALNHLRNSGVLGKVLTRAPAVLASSAYQSEYLEERLSQGERKVFRDSVGESANRLYQTITQEAEFVPYATPLVQEFLRYQSLVLDAALLRPEDFASPRIIVRLETDSLRLNEAIRSPWEKLLQDSPGVSIRTVRVTVTDERAPRGDVSTHLLRRLAVGGFAGVVSKIAPQLEKVAKAFGGRQIGLIGSNELMRETAACFAMHGASLIRLKDPQVRVEGERSKLGLRAAEIVAPHFRERLRIVPVEAARHRVEQLFLESIMGVVFSQILFFNEWQKLLGAVPGMSLILSSFRKGPSAAALRQAADEGGVRIAVFQHGATREFLEDPTARAFFFENTFAHDFFVFDEQAQRVSVEALPLGSRARVHCVGAPADFRNVSRFSLRRTGVDFLYASPVLMSGNCPNGVFATTDVDSLAEERELFALFRRLPHRVDVKPYPAVRFVDPDLALADVRSAPELRLVGGHEDLRYMIGRYRLIITGRATSTCSWVVSSGIPLVFLDDAKHSRLSSSARDDFAAAFFLFDRQEPDWKDGLFDFLSRPFEQIERDWVRKSAIRQSVIRRYFAANYYGAGKRARDILTGFN